MRRQIKIVSRKLSRWPFIGRFVHIAAAIYHLPRLRGQVENMVPRIESLDRDSTKNYSMLANSNAALNRRLLSVEQSAIGLLTDMMNEVGSVKGEVNALTTSNAEKTLRFQKLSDEFEGIRTGLDEACARLDEHAKTLFETSVIPADMHTLRMQLADGLAESKALTLRLSELNSALPTIRDDIASVRQTADEAATMARGIASLNGTVDNIVRSMPIALREMRREQVELRRAFNGNVEGAATRSASEGLTQSPSGALEQLVSLGDQLSARDSEQWGAEVASLTERFQRVADAQATSDQQVRGFIDTLDFLVGRIEFVRREVLYEVRYGKQQGDTANQPLKVASKIIATEKVTKALQEGLRLNLGCGHVPLEGYVNVDRRALPGVDIVSEVEDLPFESGDAIELFSSHVLEHFPQEQLVRELLPYWRDLLRVGGELRAVVPDARAMIEQYANGAYAYDDMREVIYGAQDYMGDFHYNMFTTESLGKLLADAGFSDIRVEASGRQNGKCYEFDIRATKAS